MARILSRCTTVASMVVCVGTGCESNGAVPDSVVVTDSAGIEIVENLGAGWDLDEAWRIASSPTVTIGAVEGEQAFEFGRYVDAVRLSTGAIVVLDQQSRELRFFDDAGNHVATVGGPGEGPGEFDFPFGLQRLAGDTLQLTDRYQRVRFTGDATLVSEVTLDHRRLGSLGSFFIQGCIGIPLFFHDQIVTCGQPQIAPPDGEGVFELSYPIVAVTADYARADTLGVYLMEQGFRTGRGVVHHPLLNRGVIAFAGTPPRAVFAQVQSYEIRVVHMDGALERIIRRVGVARRLTRAEIDEANRRARDMSPRVEFDVEAITNVVLSSDSVPVIGTTSESPSPRFAIGFDSRRYLWVVRWDSGPSGGTLYDVFSPEGRLLGPVEAPPGLSILEVGDDYVLGVRYDQHMVPFVESHALRRD